jgi:hypothetical protein
MMMKIFHKVKASKFDISLSYSHRILLPDMCTLKELHGIRTYVLQFSWNYPYLKQIRSVLLKPICNNLTRHIFEVENFKLL